MAFRTVASAGVGFGHLRRCLTLADELARRGCQIQFWIEGDEAARGVASAAGFAVQSVSGDEPAATLRLAGAAAVPIAALVADSYALDADYFRAVRPRVGCLLVIDDLANRPLDADVVSNGSANAAALAYHTGADCTLLLGPRYALLRSTFRGLPARRQGEVRRVLVTLGGGDPQQSTATVVEQLLSSLPAVAFDVVVGPLFGADAVASLKRLASTTDRVALHHAPGELQGLMTTCDLAVSGGGQTLYELAACGLPTVALCLADNQRGQLAALAGQGALLLGGGRDESGQSSSFADLGPAVTQLAGDLALRQRMSVIGQRLVDGEGTLRVADALLSKLKSGARKAPPP
ncbi:MAG TPA: UDP-2,4-diacetamido-2,4,6-trideoxy-beta-L-altropyranose hydrolase [Polyangia bacterium]|nr:UDP-2,4-diacetamido-2,4,6-trideoxy-beta-L-altropyranose hydrolase [Polyangia bacterium]